MGVPGKVEPGSAGTLGVLLYAAERGAVKIARVHDVAATRAALMTYATLAERG